MTRLAIDIYSDVICPWCYVGKRRLERALDRVQGSVDPQIIWKPFQLNPTMPREGMERDKYLQAKFGSLEAFRQMEEHLLEAGKGEGIAFALDKIRRTPNTFLAHRLIWYSETQGRQDAVVESIFRGYFEEGADIGSRAILAGLADRAGLHATDTDHFLASDEGSVEVKTGEADAHRLGIRGVPLFVLNRTQAISGAQPADVFVSAFSRSEGRIREGISGR
ncbi:MAG TPA: DsbA family oxidoreductase [Nitrospira sp.]